VGADLSRLRRSKPLRIVQEDLVLCIEQIDDCGIRRSQILTQLKDVVADAA
jgi:hypothetical protein